MKLPLSIHAPNIMMPDKIAATHRTRYLKLPISFDVASLKADLAKIREEEWGAHFNTAAYEREWRCVPLHSMEGKSDHIISLADVHYEDAAILDRCPGFRAVIDAFECEKNSARLMAMEGGAGSELAEKLAALRDTPP